MIIRLNRRRAQSTGEYAILIGLVIAAVIGMQVFVKRGLQAKTKNVVEYFADNATTTGTGSATLTKDTQYEPYYLDDTQNIVERSGSRTISTTTISGSTAKITTGLNNETTTRKSGSYQGYQDATGYTR